MKLELYVLDSTIRSTRAAGHMNELVRRYPEGECEFTIHDLSNEPDTARARNILVSPTLIRVDPKPEIRIVGDLSDIENVMRHLEEGQDLTLD